MTALLALGRLRRLAEPRLIAWRVEIGILPHLALDFLPHFLVIEHHLAVAEVAVRAVRGLYRTPRTVGLALSGVSPRFEEPGAKGKRIGVANNGVLTGEGREMFA